MESEPALKKRLSRHTTDETYLDYLKTTGIVVRVLANGRRLPSLKNDTLQKGMGQWPGLVVLEVVKTASKN
jgi:hypothetical protein